MIVNAIKEKNITIGQLWNVLIKNEESNIFEMINKELKLGIKPNKKVHLSVKKK